MARILLITNPVAARAQEQTWQRVARGLESAGWRTEVAVTQAPGHARELAQQGVAAGVDTVAVFGGDGTTMQAASALVGTEVALGLVPGGTGSDLCKSLGIPSAPGAALQMALAGEPGPLDAFEVRCGDGPLRYCVNTVSTGVAGVVVEAVNRLTRRGAAVYTLTTIKALFGYRPVHCRVDIDGATAYQGPIFLLAIANGATFGKGMKVAPRARVDDGLADVVVVGNLPRWQLPFRLPQLQLGHHLKMKAVLFRQARSVRCEPLGPFTAYELDGDVGPPGPMEMKVLPGALRVLR